MNLTVQINVRVGERIVDHGLKFPAAARGIADGQVARDHEQIVLGGAQRRFLIGGVGFDEGLVENVVHIFGPHAHFDDRARQGIPAAEVGARHGAGLFGAPRFIVFCLHYASPVWENHLPGSPTGPWALLHGIAS